MITIRKKNKYLIIECLIAIYIFITNIINILNQLTVLHMQNLWIMRKTFWGPSLLIMLITLYTFYSNNEEELIDKIMPYAVCGCIAGVLSVGSMSMNLLLVFVLGCLIQDIVQRDRVTKEFLKYVLISAIGIEGYSILLTIATAHAGVPETGAKFIYTIAPDCLLIFFLLIDILLEQKIEWVYRYYKNWKAILSVTGKIMCGLSIICFFTFLIIFGFISKENQKNTEKIYLVESTEEPSKVLTALENNMTGEFEIVFMNYTGSNNQKICIKEESNGICQLVFLEPNLALSIYTMDDGEGELQLQPQEDIDEQKWRIVLTNDRYHIYSIEHELNYFLKYDGLGSVTVRKENLSNDNFILERTIRNENITKNVGRYYDDFKPTSMLKTMYALLNGKYWIIYALIINTLIGIIYTRRIVGKLIAISIGVCFAWMIPYGALGAIAILITLVGMILKKNNN